MDKAKQAAETTNYLGKYMHWIPKWERDNFYKAIEKTVQERLKNESMGVNVRK